MRVSILAYINPLILTLYLATHSYKKQWLA